MLIEALLTMLAAAAPQKPPSVVVAPASALAAAPSPAYQPEARAVDNWRVESALALEMAPLAAIRRAVGAEEGEPARCVKLNNYWCIKSAGWNGEIAADSDGHVAFASAAEGAAVAALLLRRYYVDYGRRSARAIVERWAPAQCSPLVSAALRRSAILSSLDHAALGRNRRIADDVINLKGLERTPREKPGPAVSQRGPASRAGAARIPPPRLAPIGFASRGLQNTLRARWLAAHGRGGVDRKTARPSRSNVIDLMPPVDLMPAPSIMAGISERPARRKKIAELRTPAPAPLADLTLPAPLPSPDMGVSTCGGEQARIAAYAAAIARGVVGGPNEDLGLFAADGLPTDNLAKAMANMAAVEIGPARPREALIRVAVAQLRQTLAESGKKGVAPAPASAVQTSPAQAGQERAISSSARP